MSASIIHTLVKEEPVSGKVYTEYIIEIRNSENKKTLTKRYKDFVTLHHSLLEMFPGIEFPSSASQILGFNPSVTSWMATKRRTVIEDRRQALEDYINELINMPEVGNCQVLVDFLELEELNEIQLCSPTKQRHNQSIGQGSTSHYMKSNMRAGIMNSGINTKENLTASRFGNLEHSKYNESAKFKNYRNGPKSAMTHKAEGKYGAQNATGIFSPYSYKRN